MVNPNVPGRRHRARSFQSSRNAEMVVLTIYGPSWLIPYTLKNVPAGVNQTWLDLLRRTLGLKIKPTEAPSFLVCTRFYRPGSYGHSTTLLSKIGDFTNLSHYKKRSYSVEVCLKTHLEQTVQQNPVPASSSEEPGVPEANPANASSDNAVASTSSSANILMGPPVMRPPCNRTMARSRSEDSMLSSVIGGVGPNGQIEDVKGLVEQRVRNIGNDLWWLARKEFRDLKANGKWEKIVGRAPKGAYVFGELFKD